MIKSTLQWLFVLVIYNTASFDMTCPRPSEWYLRSKAKCLDHYTCLFDENQNYFSESCTVKFDFQRPGYRVTLRTNLHAAVCPDDLYQPFVFYNNMSSNCDLKWSFCSEEGQLVSSYGTSKTDRQCRCNYANGYSYVIRPTNICSCIPSVEDCTCYHKKCSDNHILSPDYQCIDPLSWSGTFLCSSILSERVSEETEMHKIESVRAGLKRERRINIPGIICSVFFILLGIFLVIVYLILKHATDTKSMEGHDNVYENDVNESISKFQQNTPSQMKTAKSEINEEILGFDMQKKDRPQLEKDIESFVETQFIAEVKKKVSFTNYLLLWGKSGCGKTTALHYIASYLHTHFGYKPITCNKPSDIFNHKVEHGKYIFVADDICGRFVFSHETFLRWKRREKHIKKLLQTNDIKLLMSCSSAAFMTNLVQAFNLFTDNALELPSDDPELRGLHKDFLPHSRLSSCIPINVFFQLPLPLIKLGSSLTFPNNVAYFENPSSFLKSQAEELRKSDFPAYCCLLLFILKKGCIDESILTGDDHHMFTAISTNVCKTLKIDISRKLFIDKLSILMDTFIKIEDGLFSIKQTYIFENVAVYFGNILPTVFIRNADPEIITQCCSLQSCDNQVGNQQFSIKIKEENENLYFQRIREQLFQRNICAAFSVREMKIPLYQRKLADFLKTFGSFDVNEISRFQCKIERETTFNIARRSEYFDLLKLFFECDTNLRFDDYPYLEIACKVNNLSFVELMVSKGIEINTPTSDGLTALLIACERGFLSIISYLVNNHADVDCTDELGNTPLIKVCKNENEEAISILLNSGADTNSVDESGLTCLMHAIKSESVNIEIIQTLLKAGAYVDVSSKDGKTALIMAIEKQRTDIINILTDYATDALSINADSVNYSADTNIINKCDNRGISPLMYACKISNDTCDVVKHLMAKGAVVNCSDDNDRTPLIAAFENGNDDLVKYLLQQGANVNLPGEKMTTPLHEMCKAGQLSNVQLLVSNGSHIDIVDRHDMTPLMLASKFGNYEIAKFLIERDAKIENDERSGTTVLMYACSGGCIKIINLLLEKEAKVNKKARNNWTSLMAYVTSKYDIPEIVNVLIEKGADVNASTKDGKSILMMASYHGHRKVVECLLHHKAKVNQEDIYGQTAIFSAGLGGFVDVLRLLVDKGADTSVQDINGDNIKSFAIKKKLAPTIDLLSTFPQK